MKWIVDSKAFEYDKHYSECKKNNQPFIKARISPGTELYLVFLDMATCDYRLTKIGLDKIHSFFQSSKLHISLDREYCTFDGVHKDNLNQFLTFLYDSIIEYNEPK